jgi:hypothetical protein
MEKKREIKKTAWNNLKVCRHIHYASLDTFLVALNTLLFGCLFVIGIKQRLSTQLRETKWRK